MREREIQLTKMKAHYQWKMFPEVGLPSGIDDSVPELPMDEQFSRVKDIDFTADALKGVGGAVGAGLVTDMKYVEDYFDLNCQVAEPELLYLRRAGQWTSDVEFGWEILNGVNPVIIRKCTKLPLPPKFPVTNEMVQPFLTRGWNLDKEMKVFSSQLSTFHFRLPVRAQCYSFFLSKLCIAHRLSLSVLILKQERTMKEVA